MFLNSNRVLYTIPTFVLISPNEIGTMLYSKVWSVICDDTNYSRSWRNVTLKSCKIVKIHGFYSLGYIPAVSTL